MGSRRTLEGWKPVGDAILEFENEDVLEDEILRDNEFTYVNADKPLESVTVHDRDKKLSPSAQIDAVSDTI